MNALIICNPRAGKQGGKEGLVQARAVLEAAGWSVRVEQSRGPGDATRLAADAVAGGIEAVLAAGGDGTMNEVVQALAGSETALGYLPYGTVNVWARELGLPLEPVEAARAMVGGRIERVDLGVVNGRYFLLMAGIGLDSEVVRRAQNVERHKRRFGILPYIAVFVSTIPRFHGADVELRYDGVIRRVQALMVVVGNTRLYGGRYHITPRAVANDGWLDVSIIKGRSPLALAQHLLPLLLAKRLRQADVETLRVRALTVTPSVPMPLQVDGELAGVTPARIEIAPLALRAIIPSGFASDVLPYESET